MGRRKSKTALLGDKLNGLLDRQPWGRQQQLFQLDRHWAEITGPKIAERTMPAFFRRDVLWVYVRSSVWMQHLQFAKPDLLAKINAFLQGDSTVTDLRWREYPPDLIYAPREEYVPPPPNVDPEAERDFRIMAENITDCDTRQAFINLWLHLTTKNREDSQP